VRDALKPMAGVEIMDLEVGKKPFKIKYDPAKHDLDEIMAALKKAGEPVTKID
jgi:copper chaperone CopZ